MWQDKKELLKKQFGLINFESEEEFNEWLKFECDVVLERKIKQFLSQQ